MNNGEQAQVQFVLNCLRSGQNRKEVMANFGHEWPNVSTKTIDRRLIAAKKQYEAELATISKLTDESIATEVEARKIRVLSVIERQELLTKMALGELEVEQSIVTKHGIEIVKVKPSHNDIKSAIAELNKMGGDYAPTKTNITVNKIGVDADEYE